MTDNEIIKALEHCRKKECNTCPCYDDEIECGEMLIGHTLDLINRQKAEIKRLEFDNVHWNDWEVKCRAINEFAERLKEKTCTKFDWNDYVDVEEIDNLVKEMTEQ